MAGDQARDRIAGALEAPLTAVGLDVEAVEITPAGKRRLLRVAVDKDGGVTLDDIAEATKEVSRVLDESDLMGNGPYTLEVSSRGVDRPLTLPRHWRRNQGRLVKLTTSGNESFTGRIASSDDTAAEVDVKGKSRTIPYADIAKAKIQIEFNRTEGDEP
ncbi:MAG: ribosome maturation factor RimP [Nocardioidaceae bacterium]